MKKTLLYFILSALLLIEHAFGESAAIKSLFIRTEKTERTSTFKEMMLNGKYFRDAVITKLTTSAGKPKISEDELIEDELIDDSTHADKSIEEDISLWLTDVLNDYNIKLPESISSEIALTEDEIFEDADSCTEESERISFRHAVIAKLTALADEPIKLGIKLIEDTSADKSDDENVNTLLTQILNDYHKINPAKPTTKIEMFLRLSYIFDFVSGPISDKLQNRNAILLVKAALEKHNLKAVAIEFQKKYDEFLQWLIPESDSKLNSKEQLVAKEFKELCLQYKEETDLQKKLFVTHSMVASLE